MRKCIPASEIKDIIKRLEMTYINQKGLVPASLPITLLKKSVEFKAVKEKI